MPAVVGGTILVATRIHDGELVAPVESLERYFRNGGATVLQAAFEHSYFTDPGPGTAENAPLPGPGSLQSRALSEPQEG